MRRSKPRGAVRRIVDQAFQTPCKCGHPKGMHTECMGIYSICCALAGSKPGSAPTLCSCDFYVRPDKPTIA